MILLALSSFEKILNKTFDYSGSLSYILDRKKTGVIVYFQALDDKKQCVGIYHDGRLIFDESEFPDSLSNMRTWRYSGFLKDDSIEYAWLITQANSQRIMSRKPYA